MENNKKYTIEDFRKIVADLRSESGCPWDKVQTHKSLKEYMIEECYESIDAINKEDYSALCEELGDVMLQVMLHSQIASERGEFTFDDVIDAVAKKMVLRHPHVFGNISVNNEEDVLKNWEKIKKVEKQYESQTEILKCVPDVLPALLRAYKVQKKAAKAPNVKMLNDDVKAYIQSSISSLNKLKDLFEDEAESEEKTKALGEIFFDVVNITRLAKINPELILADKTESFINEFEKAEKQL